MNTVLNCGNKDLHFYYHLSMCEKNNGVNIFISYDISNWMSKFIQLMYITFKWHELLFKKCKRF